MKTPEEIKKGFRCCNGEFIACADCPYGDGSGFGHDGCGEELVADVLAYIETLEGIIKENPKTYLTTLVGLVSELCDDYLHCSDCPLSDADGDCPFIGKDGRRLMPGEWELERMSGREP